MYKSLVMSKFENCAGLILSEITSKVKAPKFLILTPLKKKKKYYLNKFQ